MNPNHCEYLLNLYTKAIMTQEGRDFSDVIANLKSTNNSAICSGTSLNPQTLLLDSEIPKEEIECDVEHILVKNFSECMKKLDTNLNGLRGRKFGFREVAEMAATRSPYAASPKPLKRSRLPDSAFMTTPLTPESMDEDETKAKKARVDASLNDSTASSHDGQLVIDLDEPENENFVAEPEVEIIEPVHEKNKSTFLRIERLRSIQTKKPKFNIDPTDLEYHSSMARDFPGAEKRSEDQQMRRDKNTLAARISRIKNKAYEKLLTDQALAATAENINIKRRIACLRVYANSLMEMNELARVDFGEMWEDNVKDILGAPAE